MLFRACTIWSHKRTINIISVVLFMLLLGEPSVYIAIKRTHCLGPQVSSGLNLWHSCSGVEFAFEGLGNPDSGCPFCDRLWGLPAVCTSLVLNIWATAAIGCKAWCAPCPPRPLSNFSLISAWMLSLELHRAHKRVIKTYLTTGNTRTRAEKVLALLVDSGALYSALWVTLP